MAVQKAGVLAARKEYPVTSRSQIPPRFLPAKTPRVKPKRPESSQEEARSQRELESFSQITSATGLRYRREVPISPLRTSAAQERYRSAGGRSTPQYPLSRSTCSGLMAPRAACPTLVWRGSTGETERRTKARMLTRATRRAMRAVWKARSPQTVFPAPCPLLPLRRASRLTPAPMSTGPHY